MKCLSVALANLSGRRLDTIEEMLNGYRGSPWRDVDMIYIAHRLGVHLTPFMQKLDGVVYPDWGLIYERYEGILCGENPGAEVGHAIAKINNYLLDEKAHYIYGPPYLKLENRIFYAWTNKR